MKISQKGKTFIKNYEGCRLKAYKCPAGVLTIGYGHTNNVRPDDVITQDEANKLFEIDIKIHENNVARLVKVALTQNQFDALVSLEYNIGYGNFSSSTLLKKLNAKDFKATAEQFIRLNPSSKRGDKDKYSGWCFIGKDNSAGLVKRRKAEKEMFLS